MRIRTAVVVVSLLAFAAPAIGADGASWAVTTGVDAGAPYEQAVTVGEGAALVLRCSRGSSPSMGVFLALNSSVGAGPNGAPEYRRIRYAFDQDPPTDTFWRYSDTVISLSHPGQAIAFARRAAEARSLVVNIYARDGSERFLLFAQASQGASAKDLVGRCTTSF
jgi:hypothetical protein